MKTELFPSCGHCWVFQICWHIECSTFTASSFRIWNSSTGIPSHPLVLFIVMLPKAHLTSHSRMSGSRWVITSSWLSGSWRSSLYSSSVYSCHLFLISSASVRSKPFLSFIVRSLVSCKSTLFGIPDVGEINSASPVHKQRPLVLRGGDAGSVLWKESSPHCSREVLHRCLGWIRFGAG